MKILITGGSGFLGQYLNLSLSPEYQVLTIYNEHPGNCLDYRSRKTDIRDRESLSNIFQDFTPDIVVHTAAALGAGSKLSSKDFYSINVIASKNIADLCRDTGAKLIYTSTDLVYAGYRGSMLKEDAKLIPASLYAETKLMGEEKIKESFSNYIILRTALMYGFGLNHSKSHFQKMYNDLSHGIKVNLFTDQYRTPLEVNDAAEMINKLCAADISGETINFGGPERVSRFELGELLCECAGFDKTLLDPY